MSFWRKKKPPNRVLITQINENHSLRIETEDEPVQLTLVTKEGDVHSYTIIPGDIFNIKIAHAPEET
jgi:hypothetical protein